MGRWVGGDAVVDYVIAVCLEEREETRLGDEEAVGI